MIENGVDLWTALGAGLLMALGCTSEDDRTMPPGGVAGAGPGGSAAGGAGAGGTGPGGAHSGGGGTGSGSSILDNQYVGHPAWCRVSVHTHPAKTSGATLAGAYADEGYDLIFFTDHDYDPQTAPVSTGGLVVVAGEEVSTDDGHCNALGTTDYVEPGMTRQETIDAAAAQGAMLQVNHPSRYGVIAAELDELSGLWGLEIKNESDNSPDDIVLWDSQLSQRKRLWGTFSDDAHDVGDVGRGWLMVNVPADCTAAAVVASMKVGNFYVTEGPSLDISVQGGTISVSSDSATTLAWYREDMTLIQTTDAASDAYTVQADEVFVRIVATDADDDVAMSMPLFTNP
ncbi:MAG: CehA/McbA family metallohydrolase [Deltaproteobacteria bacterium]|nr:CehA/McbA family metallohydrolase [Deltaproteobacteria bacterium]MBW2531416.1 CehA/McbA family metallohydrolase [Deltaproteobacteria bacterium]